MRALPKTARNKEIIVRHYEGNETYKNIAATMEVSYGRVVNIARELRRKMLKRIQNGESLSEIAVDYRLQKVTVKAITDEEQLREDAAEERHSICDADHYEAKIRQNADLQIWIYTDFRSGTSVADISDTYTIPYEDVLRMLEDQLTAIICR